MAHHNDVIMRATASQIPSLAIVYPTVYSGTDQRKHQSSALLAFVRGIHRWPVNSPHKGPVTRKMFPFDDVIMDLWGSAVIFREIPLTFNLTSDNVSQNILASKRLNKSTALVQAVAGGDFNIVRQAQWWPCSPVAYVRMYGTKIKGFNTLAWSSLDKSIG